MALVTGTAGNDLRSGTSVADSISGLDGNDTLYGNGGNDTLNGGAGNDSMMGGVGNDEYHVDSAGDKVVESSGDVADVVWAYVSYTQPQNVETMNLAASAGSIDGTGNYQANRLNGNDAANSLDGAAGADTLSGNGGNDVLVGGLGADSLIGGAGDDTFSYWEYAESGTTLWDRIADLSGSDVVDLSQLDANRGDGSFVAGGTAYDPVAGLTWIGSAAFSAATPGQARFNAATGLVEVSNDADAEAEFAVHVGTTWTDTTILPFLRLVDTVAPVFTTPGANVLSMTENSGSGTVVYDANTDDRKTTFQLRGDDVSYFSINAVTGVVTLVANPDYEADPVLSYTVVAIDHVGNETLLARTLAVLDAGEAGAVITSAGTGAVNENQNLLYDAEVSPGGYQWSLAGTDASLLTIGASTGIVTRASGNLDHETQASYSFTVIASNGVDSVTKPVTITVNDLDDAAPVFTSATTASVDENVAPGTQVYDANSHDTVDDVSVGPTTYSLVAGGDAAAFTINATTGVVTINASPDQEVKSSYGFTVRATDGAGNAALQAVSLGVTDLDDTAPVFTSGTSANVDENVPAGTVVYTAQTRDDDDVSTGPTTYSLGTAGGDEGRFTINANGELSINASPNYEVKSSYQVEVKATDGANNQRAQTVTITVNDLDDAPPTFTSGTTASIDENEPANTIVYTAAAAGVGITYSLGTAGGDEGSFAIDGSSGVVTINASPDQETKAGYSIQVLATDGTGNQSSRTVAITVNDLDEVAPSFTSGATASVNENVAAGTTVYRAASTDTGDISTGPIRYSLAAGVGDEASFAIDAASGVVTIDHMPDHENDTGYTFDVVVTDGAGNSRTRTIALGVNDLDEEVPRFTSGTAVNVNENVAPGTTVYTVVADDTADVSAGVTYSLGGSHDEGGFTINGSTGVVTINTSPDYEADTGYTIEVLADDGVHAPVSQLVTISVVDLDDGVPVFTSPTTAIVNENVVAGTTVYTAVAADAGGGAVTYSLGSAGGNEGSFTIDGTSGAVTINAAPDHETRPSYSFQVLATDGSGNQTARTVVLTVNDLDEAAPVFTSGTTASVNENAPAGTTVYTATSTDTLDVSTGPIVYSFGTAGGDEAAFGIDGSSGAVTINQSPNFETKSSYTLQVLATDGAGNQGARIVNVSVANVDETAPAFTSASSVSVNENVASGTTVYTAIASDTGDGTSGAVTYRFGSAGDEGSFTINATTGVVKINVRPNHEVKTSYSIAVIATDAAGNQATRNVTVNVVDLDDAAPVFTSGLTGSVVENTAAGAAVYTATSHDNLDNIVVGPTTYSLGRNGGDEGSFSINPSTGVVTLNAVPDAELKPTYRIQVRATDGANNQRSQIVTITVGDRDDGAPVFTSGTSATFNENIAPGTTVYTALTHDSADNVSVGPTTYSFGTAGGDEGSFTLNPTTGAVTINAAPDYEVKSSYAFQLIATDGAGNQGYQVVTLGIRDIDDAAPVFTSGTTTSVNENVAPGTTVYTATSHDDGDNVSIGPTTYSLGTGGDEAAFTMSSGGTLTINASPNHEVKSSYSVQVRATDGWGNQSAQTVTIAVNDLDDAAPAFTSGTTASVDENVAAGTLVYTAVTADTGDDTVTGPTTYSLGTAGGNEGSFTIDASSGAVTINSSPNQEARGSYSIQVLATDAAGNQGSRTVTITVNDLDEVAPSFTSGTSASVDENVAIGTTVYTATSTDTGDISTGPIRYSLAPGVGDETSFDIDATSGAVTIDHVPDHENDAGYTFDVVVTDGAGNSRTRTVVLAVNDLDEQAPTFTSANSANVNENVAAGRAVYTAVADDTADVSAGVTYSLGAAGGDEGSFTIDASTGVVTIDASPDYEADTGYTIEVVADDGVNAAVTQLVTISVVDLDDGAPVFTSLTTANVNENVAAGTLVYTAAAVDTTDDVSVGPMTYYYLGSDHGNFTIDSSTGALTIDNSPDHETYTSYIIQLRAADGAGNQSFYAVTLNVNDLDEIAPVFTSGTTGSIDENSAIGTAVYTATSTDTLDVSMGPITYSLQDPLVGDAARFAIDGISGVVTILEVPDHESNPDYTFVVLVTDGALNQRSRTVTVTVNDLDEVAPAFTSATTGSVNENVPAGTTIYTATSTDTGDISTGATTYSFGVGSGAGLTLDASTGVVTVNASPDQETAASYAFEIVATDAAGNSAAQNVTIGVVDLDDAAPVFTSGGAASVDENVAGGTTVYTAVTHDNADNVSASPTTYSMVTGAGSPHAAWFTVNAASGVVTIDSSPNYELLGSYTFQLRATDAAGNSSTETVTLTINNLDEVAPVITSATTASVAENVAAGTPVYDTESTDTGDVSAGVTYSLGNAGGDEGSFTIDPSSGVVTIDASPDYEADSSYSFQVKATDGAGNFITRLVTLSVTDVDEAPAFALVADSGSVQEDTAVVSGFLVATGTLLFSDDIGDSQAISITAVGAGYLGSIAVVQSDFTAGDPAGAIDWTFSLDNSDATLQALGAGDTLTQVYQVQLDDGTFTDTLELTVYIVGIAG